MIIELSAEAQDFGAGALRAFQAAGGDELVQAAEADPRVRETSIATVFAELGAWDLQPRKDSDELEAAAALCRSSGYWGLPYPVAERLARPSDLGTDGLLVVSDHNPEAAISDLDLSWTSVTMNGRRGFTTARATRDSPRRSAFVTGLDTRHVDDDGGADIALGLLLPCWTMLGMLDRAIDLTRTHVLIREQFGQSLSRFQSVQFQLTEAEVERSGVEILAKYALWSVEVGHEETVDDALALRLATIEAADAVFRIAHQLHGATGFCDETTLSWISRYSLPIRRLPMGLSATTKALTDNIGKRGLTGLFSDPRALVGAVE